MSANPILPKQKWFYTLLLLLLLILHLFNGLLFQDNQGKSIPEKQNQSGFKWGKRWWGFGGFGMQPSLKIDNYTNTSSPQFLQTGCSSSCRPAQCQSTEGQKWFCALWQKCRSTQITSFHSNAALLFLYFFNCNATLQHQTPKRSWFGEEGSSPKMYVSHQPCVQKAHSSGIG